MLIFIDGCRLGITTHVDVYWWVQTRNTPSLPQPVKFPGWKMRGCVCKQYIFQSCNTCSFNAMHFDESPFACQCKIQDKYAKGFHILHFYCSFSSDIMPVKGLMGERISTRCNGNLSELTKQAVSFVSVGKSSWLTCFRSFRSKLTIYGTERDKKCEES